MTESTIEPSIFYSPIMARVSEIVIDISFALSSLLFPVMLWLIFRHSRTLGKYRWYMLANVLFCYAFDVWLTLSKPVFLGPLLGWYLQGFVQANSFTSCVMFSVLVYLMNAMDFSIFCSLFYRWAQVGHLTGLLLDEAFFPTGLLGLC